MVDTAESRLLLRLQSTGSNTNLWGGYLDTNQQMLARASKGYQAIAMTGDQTIAWTNYSLTNIGAVKTIKLTGSLSSAANLIVPSLEMDFTIINATGATVTVKTSAGTGVVIATGYQAALYCDGTDVKNASPTVLGGAASISGALSVSGIVSGVATGVAATDAVNKTQMETAIATLLSGTVTGLALVSSTDTTANYLNSKITVSGSLIKSITSPAGNEALNIAFTFDEGNAVLLAGAFN